MLVGRLRHSFKFGAPKNGLMCKELSSRLAMSAQPRQRETNMRKVTLAVLTAAAAVCAVGLAGCGGGGRGLVPPPDNPPVSTPTNPPVSTPTELSLFTPTTAERPTALHKAAGASPQFGSVSQGSNVSAGVTTDQVSIAYLLGSDGFHPVATIRTGKGTVLSSNDNPRSVDVLMPAGRIVQMTVDGPDQGNVPSDELQRLYTPADRKVLDEGSFIHAATYEQWVSPYDSLQQHPKGRVINEVEIVDVLDESVTGTGKNYTAVGVSALTDYPAAFAADARDYLTWGSWVYFTITPTDLDFSYGAFADGVETVETAASEIPLAGIASYAGLTQALAVIRGDRPTRGNLDDDAYWNDRVAHLRGDVNLHASFASGTVTGRVENIDAFALQGSDEPAPHFPSVTIDLGAASIEKGTFKGDARATSGLPGAVGKWGGQFFGTPAAGAAPPAAGGTWGVTQGTGDNDWKVVGGFGSWR